jgi:hypothetical protein
MSTQQHDPFAAQIVKPGARAKARPAPKRTAKPRTVRGEEVPENAADVAAWIVTAGSPAKAKQRARKAWTVETARPAGVRKTVATMDADAAAVTGAAKTR